MEFPVLAEARKMDGMIMAEAAAKRVLLVDDDETLRKTLAEQLTQSGEFECLEAGSGAEALARLPDSGVNLLISDIGMPEMTGHELIARVRARSPAPGLRAIALTAFAGEADRQRALDAGFEAHFRKPVDFSALVRAIQDMGLSVSNPAPPDRRTGINPSKDPS